jgi:hypothetical protein
MEALFHEMLQTLREARSAVTAEIRQIGGADIFNPGAARRLRRSAEEFDRQAGSLVVMMQHRGAEEALVIEAEELCEFFEAAQERATLLLGEPQT